MFDWNQYQQAPNSLTMTGAGPSNGGMDTGIGVPVQTLAAPTGSTPTQTVTPPPSGPFGGGVNTNAAGQTQPSGTAGGPITIDQFNQAWMSSPYPGTVDGLKQFYAAHPEYAAAGITLGGSKGDKVYGPGGTYWGDYVQSAGTGGTGKLTGSGPSAGGGGSQGSTLAGLGYNFGDAMKPLAEFTPPTEQDALNSPGLQFALSEANRMGQNSAAAKGTLLNGRFQQGLYASNIQNALQGYGDVYNRAANTFGINYGVRKDNRDSPFNKNLSLAELGAPK